jgi:hypothetical protein
VEVPLKCSFRKRVDAVFPAGFTSERPLNFSTVRMGSLTSISLLHKKKASANQNRGKNILRELARDARKILLSNRMACDLTMQRNSPRRAAGEQQHPTSQPVEPVNGYKKTEKKVRSGYLDNRAHDKEQLHTMKVGHAVLLRHNQKHRVAPKPACGMHLVRRADKLSAREVAARRASKQLCILG